MGLKFVSLRSQVNPLWLAIRCEKFAGILFSSFKADFHESSGNILRNIVLVTRQSDFKVAYHKTEINASINKH